MSSDPSESIFDHAARSSKKRKPRTKKKRGTKGSAHPKPTASTSDVPQKKREPHRLKELQEELEDRELADRYHRAEEYYRELLDKTADTYERMGISAEEARQSLADPDIPNEEWKDLNLRAKELEKDLFDGRIKGLRRRILARRKLKKLKRRKRKMLGARKGWLRVE